METSALLYLLESILGKSKKTSKGNYAFFCLNNCHLTKPKFEINLLTQQYSCWVCGSHSDGYRGKSLKQLFKRLKVTQDKLDELALLVSEPTGIPFIRTEENVELPSNYLSLDPSIISKLPKLGQIKYYQARAYLESRKISTDIYKKYNIGFCWEGPYYDRIIIPSYDENGILNYFMARDFTGNLYQKYKNPPISSKNVVGFELYINWNLPIILVEGIMDAISIKRNVIPLFGKILYKDGELMKKIIKSSVHKIYICLDKDAQKDIILISEKLMSEGKEVYIIDLPTKDAGETDFGEILEVLEKAIPLTFEELITKKLNML